MPEAAVKCEVKDGGIGLITLNRPHAKNALNPEAVVLLTRAWERFAKDPSIRVVVITGAGDCFCSGADLGRLITLISGEREPEDEWDREIKKDPTITQKALLRTNIVQKPVICAVNGHAIAGGMELLQGTDIRVCSKDALFGLQEPKWGLFPVGGSTVRLPRQIPFAIAMEILLTAKLLDSKRALKYGLVNYVVEKDEVLPKALELAKMIVENGPTAVQAIWKSVRECLGLPERQGLDLELEIGMPVFQHPDAREGPKSFKEKRKPVWKGPSKL